MFNKFQPGSYVNNDIKFTPGLEKHRLFSFLDLSDVDSEKEANEIYENEKNYYKASSLYNYEDETQYDDVKFLKEFRQVRKVQKPPLIYRIPAMYEIALDNGGLYLSWKDIQEYLFIRKNAIKMYEEPIVLLSSEEACSLNFKIHRGSPILPFEDRDWFYPVDLYNKNKKAKKYWWTTNSNEYLVATTYLAYILERFYLKPNGTTLEEMHKKGKDNLLFVPNKAKRINKRASLPSIEELTVANVGLFNNDDTKLVYDCCTIDHSLIDDYPISISRNKRWMYIPGNTKQILNKFKNDDRVQKAIKILSYIDQYNAQQLEKLRQAKNQNTGNWVAITISDKV